MRFCQQKHLRPARRFLSVMREIVSPLSGIRSPISRVDPYKAAGFRPTLVADMTRDYYRNTSR